MTVLGIAAYLLRRAILQEHILHRTPAFGTIQPKLKQTIETAKEDTLFLVGTAAYSHREIHDEFIAVALLRQEAVARLPAVALAEKFGRVAWASSGSSTLSGLDNSPGKSSAAYATIR